MHLSFILEIFHLIFKKNNSKSIFVLLVLLFFYYKIIGSISILRCIVQMIIKLLNNNLNLNINKWKYLVISILVVLIICPNALYEMGFYYSFIISSSLFLTYKQLYKVKNYFIKIFYISFFSFLLSLPLNLYNYI